jgi:GntR family transcriptional regulator
VQPRHAEQWITATGAAPHVAAALGVAAGAPLLKIERIMRDKDNKPIEFIDARYRPDRFQYHVKS